LDTFSVFLKNKIQIGQITFGIYLPRLKKNVGLSMILKDHWNIDEKMIVQITGNINRSRIITSLPFPE
jgi:dimethylsulfoniopropionate demethylase